MTMVNLKGLTICFFCDRTMKFWDLETFQLVSSTDADCGPIRCVVIKLSC